MDSEGLKKKLAALRERRARIDAEIKQLEAQLDAQERAGQKGAPGVVAHSVPAWTVINGEAALLLEDAGTNLLTYSEDFSNAAWTKAGTVTANAETVYCFPPSDFADASKETPCCFFASNSLKMSCKDMP